MSTRIEGTTAHVVVAAHATLSAGPVHLSLSAREGPASGTWRYNRAAAGQFATGTERQGESDSGNP